VARWLAASPSSRQSIVKGLRLAQLCNGFLGGVDSLELDPFKDHDEHFEKAIPALREPVREIGREKLDRLMLWLSNGRPNRLLTWCRFRLELDRAAEALSEHYCVFKLQGGQTRDERRIAIRALAPRQVFTEPTAVVGNAQAGGAALNLSGASIAVYLSLDFRLRVLNQSKGRIARPGQENSYRYVYMRATGPKGQKTIDHQILKALFDRQNVKDWTTQQWRIALREE
jgi:hypothetical protein